MNIAVLMGGVSSEREVSLRSGSAVATGLREKGHRAVETVVDDRSLRSLEGSSPDAVFVALHGAFGEDGEVQAMLEARGIPYTGSGPEASRRAMDKLMTKEILEGAAVPHLPHVPFSGNGSAAGDRAATIAGRPVVG